MCFFRVLGILDEEMYLQATSCSALVVIAATVIGFLSSVNFIVSLKAFCLGSSEVTAHTLVWLLSSVGVGMILQTTSCST